MKVLVINTGSSSVKYQLFDMSRRSVLAAGVAERIGEQDGTLTHRVTAEPGKDQERKIRGTILDHRDGLKRITDLLTHREFGVLRDESEISAVGHRVVHGGEAFKAPTIIDADVIAEIRRNTPLAPLHNPSNLVGIEVARTIFPDAPQVAVFDTAFHQTIPEQAYLYALPYELYENSGVRRYGFHGTSHAYVSEMAAGFLGRPLNDLNMITVHLGNGASMAALSSGRCVDTSMGMTPLEGLVMGTRTGDVDPALPFFLSRHLRMSLDQIDDLLNRKSGLKGICGTNDMREVLERAHSGDDRARSALGVYTYRIRKYIGAYYAVLGGIDCLVFTGGIGENAPIIRERCCHGLGKLGIALDPSKNHASGEGIREISTAESDVSALVVQTNEELKIAQETEKVVRDLHATKRPPGMV